ncbi:hypothetical protein SCHPADRAFT_896489 [Schizopora paradoxa]|uniref:Uncharacterized protein n=1 Tax=Schizopora paradoxa TaxID=27342 RepID=A0A0H2R0B7_9AGAM|nr:hypothetical protein SCHPADRAFT_896489 [Schizopora paradoxa]
MGIPVLAAGGCSIAPPHCNHHFSTTAGPFWVFLVNSERQGARTGKDRGRYEKFFSWLRDLACANVNRPRSILMVLFVLVQPGAWKPPWAAPQGRGFSWGSLLILLVHSLNNSSCAAESTSLGSLAAYWAIPDAAAALHGVGYGLSKFGWPPHPAPEVAGEVQNATFEVALQFEFKSKCFQNLEHPQAVLAKWYSFPAKSHIKPIFIYKHIDYIYMVYVSYQRELDAKVVKLR